MCITFFEKNIFYKLLGMAEVKIAKVKVHKRNSFQEGGKNVSYIFSHVL